MSLFSSIVGFLKILICFTITFYFFQPSLCFHFCLLLFFCFLVGSSLFVFESQYTNTIYSSIFPLYFFLTILYSFYSFTISLRVFIYFSDFSSHLFTISFYFIIFLRHSRFLHLFWSIPLFVTSPVYSLPSFSSSPRKRIPVGFPIYFLPSVALVFRFATDIVLSSRGKIPHASAEMKPQR